MKVHSLGRRTDFIFARFSGVIEDKGKYILIKTPLNPGYHWGNYIVFCRAPKKGDLVRWKALFDREFPYYSVPHHYVFAWDCEVNDRGVYQEFLDDGFEFEIATVLTAKELQKPPKLNKDICIRKILTAAEWEAVIDLQTLCADSKFLNEYYIEFKKTQMYQYKKMSEAGKGNWFGAFIGGKLVGDLGIFFESKIARYQNVGTHPDFRRQGICGTLVYEAGHLVMEEYGVETLVMEADPGYHAAKIYESVGFVRSETNYSLSWWKSNQKL